MNSIVIGDVHGCGEELEELLEFLLERDPSVRIRLVGDLLTKGPEPARVVRVLDRLRASGVDVASVCGNHDLRLFTAFVRLGIGRPLASLRGTERATIERLIATGGLASARRLMSETVDRTRCTAGAATVVHAGIDPVRGLHGTSDHELVHRKARSGRRHWWKDYDGDDGLIVVGHKPMRSPLRVTRDHRPIVVNVDTGCVNGGRLSAYHVEEDAFISVESRQSRTRRRGMRLESPDSLDRPVGLAG